MQVAGVAVQAAGVLVLYLHWRAKGGLGGVAVVAGWVMIAAGGAPWLLAVSAERGLAIAMLTPMTMGLALLAPDALARFENRGKRKPERTGETLEPDASAPGRTSRNMARWIGALIAAPAFALASAAAWQAWGPGNVVDRVAFSIFALMLAWTAALLWVLSAPRPWRAAAVTTLGALALGGGAYLFVSSGAV